MKGYQIKSNHVLLNTQNGEYALKDEGYVIGISVEILSTSLDAVMKYGLSEAPKIQINQGEPARGYGGFETCGVPCYYEELFRWSFTTNNGPLGLLIISILVPNEKDVIP